MANYTYIPTGVCSQAINFELTADGVLHNVEFIGGCDGNSQGVSRLVEGQNAQEVAKKLAGIPCGGKPTSCPDQLACAIAATQVNL